MPVVPSSWAQARRVAVVALAHVYLPGLARAAAMKSPAEPNRVLAPRFMYNGEVLMASSGI